MTRHQLARQDKATRPWRLRGYTGKAKTDKPVHESICHGDRALNAALKELEANPEIVRITAEQAW